MECGIVNFRVISSSTGATIAPFSILDSKVLTDSYIFSGDMTAYIAISGAAT